MMLAVTYCCEDRSGAQAQSSHVEVTIVGTPISANVKVTFHAQAGWHSELHTKSVSISGNTRGLDISKQ